MRVIPLAVAFLLTAGSSFAAPAAPQPAAPPISLTLPQAKVPLHGTLPVVWKTTGPVAEIEIQYSANEGRSWHPWQRIVTRGAPSGTARLTAGWSQFNWLYMSYGKVRWIFSQGMKKEKGFDWFLGNPLQIRALDAQQPGLSALRRDATVTAPAWLQAVYIGSFLMAAFFFYMKARWDEAPRRDLSFIFNVTCTACFVAKTTFLLAFWTYLIVGLALWHRIRIVKARRDSPLIRVYDWTTISTAIGFAVLLVVGLVLRVRDFVFG